MARLLRIAFTFLGIVALFPLAALAWFSFTQSNLYINIYGVYDSAGFVRAFIDEDTDGLKDPSEAPLPAVCIILTYRPDPPPALTETDPCRYADYQETDQQGNWKRFLPGGDCRGLYVFAVPPEGFQSTNTPAARACSAEFGFVREGTVISRPFPTAQEFATRESIKALAGRVAIAVVVLGTAALGTWLLNKPRAHRASAG